MSYCALSLWRVVVEKKESRDALLQAFWTRRSHPRGWKGRVPGEQKEEEACVCMYPFVTGKRQAASKAPDLAGLGLHGSGHGAAGFGGMVVSRL